MEKIEKLEIKLVKFLKNLGQSLIKYNDIQTFTKKLKALITC